MPPDALPEPDRTPVDARIVARVAAILVGTVAAVVAAALAWHRTSVDRPTVPRPIAIEAGRPALQVAPGRDRRAYDAEKAADAATRGDATPPTAHEAPR